MKTSEKERFDSVKKVTSKLLPTYAKNKKIRNIYKAHEKETGGISVQSILNQYDIRILPEGEGDLGESKELEKHRKTESERGMLDDAFRYLLFTESRVESLSVENADEAQVSQAFIMDNDRNRCYALASSEAKSLVGQIVLLRPQGKTKPAPLEQVCSMIQNYFSELSILLNASKSAATPKQSSASPKKEKSKKKKHKSSTSSSGEEDGSSSASESSSSSSSSESSSEGKKKKSKSSSSGGKGKKKEKKRDSGKKKKEKKSKKKSQESRKKETKKPSTKRLAEDTPTSENISAKRVKLEHHSPEKTESAECLQEVVEEEIQEMQVEEPITTKILPVKKEMENIVSLLSPSLLPAPEKTKKKPILSEYEEHWGWWNSMMKEEGKM